MTDPRLDSSSDLLRPRARVETAAETPAAKPLTSLMGLVTPRSTVSLACSSRSTILSTCSRSARTRILASRKRQLKRSVCARPDLAMAAVSLVISWICGRASSMIRSAVVNTVPIRARIGFMSLVNFAARCCMFLEQRYTAIINPLWMMNARAANATATLTIIRKDASVMRDNPNNGSCRLPPWCERSKALLPPCRRAISSQEVIQA
jgi:hypothetical protein